MRAYYSGRYVSRLTEIPALESDILNTNLLNRWITLAANVGVLVGIIFLALEISQSNRIATSATESDIRERWSNIGNSIIENPEFGVTWVKLQNTDPELSKVERSQILSYARNHWLLFASVEEAHVNELISDNTFSIYSDILANVLRNNPGFAPYFRIFVMARSDSNVAESTMTSIALKIFEELGI